MADTLLQRFRKSSGVQDPGSSISTPRTSLDSSSSDTIQTSDDLRSTIENLKGTCCTHMEDVHPDLDQDESSSDIEKMQLAAIKRIVGGHEDCLGRYGYRLEKHDDRLEIIETQIAKLRDASNKSRRLFGLLNAHNRAATIGHRIIGENVKWLEGQLDSLKKERSIWPYSLTTNVKIGVKREG